MSHFARPFFLVAVVLLTSQPAANAKSLLINGDFEAGNAGFSSQYPNLGIVGGYEILSDPRPFNGDFFPLTDHDTPGGLMMVVDGATSSPPPYVWQETVDVSQAGTTSFVFSGWAASISRSNPQSPAVLRFTVDGVQVGSDFRLPAVTNGEWVNFMVPFTEFGNTATIRIFDMNTEFIGNDFALDDLNLVGVPEPASLILLGLGLVGVAGLSWRRVALAPPVPFRHGLSERPRERHPRPRTGEVRCHSWFPCGPTLAEPVAPKSQLPELGNRVVNFRTFRASAT